MTATITITKQTSKIVRLEVDGMKISLHAEDYHARPGRKPRVYLSGSSILPAWQAPAWSVKGDDAENDKAWRKYNAEEIRLQKVLAERALAVLRQLRGFSLHGSGELRFSRKGGCSCGCSPAMLLDYAVFGADPLFQWTTRIGDIFVESD